MSVGHLNFFFGEVSVQLVCPVFNWIICFFVEVCELFVYFGCQPFIGSVIYEYILPYCTVPFCPVGGVLCCTEGCQLDLFIFAFVFLAWGDMFVKKSLMFMSKRFLPMFFSKSFLVSGRTFRSLIHFKFTFVCGVRQ